MTGNDLLKRTPLRLAATFTALFVTAAAMLFAFLYVRLGAELETQIRQRVDETSSALVALDARDGFDRLADIIDSESTSIGDEDTIFLLIDQKGDFRAGNVRGIGVAPNWMILEREGLVFVSDRGQPDDKFFAKWTSVSGGKLLVGSSDREIQRTRMVLFRGLGWGLAGTLLLAAACATLLALRAQTRIDAIAKTLEAASLGQLDARVPISKSRDDIDQVGEQINRTLDHLKVLVDTVKQASSDIAHDLKKPISRLHETLEEARRTAINPSEFRVAIDNALCDLESIVETFEALLNIAQIEAGARKSHFRSVDLGQVLADAKEIYEAVAEDSGDILSVEGSLASPAVVRGDKELLTQLLANLIENSIRHCPSGTRIELGLSTASGGGCSIFVADNGPGIPADERINVLRRFYRLERQRTSSGNGLGLSVVSAIAELHDAALVLEDNAPGLSVVITFPTLAP
ncbi:MAG: ATP-binding protein [Beijerinckiaceae bacterium]